MQGTPFDPWSRKSHLPRGNKARATTLEFTLWSPLIATVEPAMPQLLKPVHPEPLLHKRAYPLLTATRKPTHNHKDPAQSKIDIFF